MTGTPAYGAKEALLGLFVGGWFLVLPGYGLYTMAPETIACARGAGAAPTCTLSRHVAGIPLRRTEVASVRGVSLGSRYSAPKQVMGRRDSGGSSFTIDLATDDRTVQSVTRSSEADLAPIVEGLTGFLDDGSASTYQATIGRGGGAWAIALWILFTLGAVFVINVPLALAKSRRGR